MKTPSTFLYDLVKKLSKSEKRYIKVQAGAGNKDYLQLMDALIAQQTFDEEKLIKDNEGANFLKNLAVNKRYLYQIVLQSLAHFGLQTWEDKVFEKLTAAKVLIEKGLLDAAFNELKKGNVIAQEYELFELQILLGNVEKKLLTQAQFKHKDEHALHQIFATQTHCLQQLENTHRYWYMTQQLKEFQKLNQKIQNHTQQAYINSLVQLPQFKEATLASNFRSKMYFYQANASYQFTIGNVEKAYEFNNQLLNLLEQNPIFLQLYTEQYLATLNNMLIDSLVIGKYDILQQGIARLSMITERPAFKTLKNIDARVFRQQYLLLLNWSLTQNDFEKAITWIPQIEQGLKLHGKKIEKHHQITFYYLVAYLLFLNKEYKQALEWNNYILFDNKENVVKEIFYFARILNLLIHYQLSNNSLLESLLLSTPQYLKRRRPIYTTEKILFQFLKKMLNTVDKTEKQELQTKFKNHIETLSKQASEKRVFNYLNLKLWISSCF